MKAKLLLPLIAILLTSNAFAADKRTFRDQKTSRAFSAVVIGIEGEEGNKVRLKLDSGKMVTVPISRLHKDDQAYLKTWAEDAKEAAAEASSADPNAQDASPKIRQSIKLAVDEEKGKATTERTGEKDLKGKTRTSSVIYGFRVDVARGAPIMKNVEVKYTIYKRSRSTDTKKKSDGTSSIEEITASEKFPELPSGITRTFKSNAVTTVDSTKPYKENKSTFEKRLSEEVMGIHAVVLVDNKKAYEVEQPSGLLRSVEKSTK
jgi:hypothetical protein